MRRITGFLFRILAGLAHEWRRQRWNLATHTRNTVRVTTRQGVFILASDSDDPIGRSLYARKQYEMELMSGAVQLLRSQGMIPERGRGTLVDIGANNGVTSIGFLHLGEFHRAIAIEPEPRNQELLRRNVDANGFTERIICLPVALSSRAGVVDFELSDTNRGDHRIRSGVALPEADERFKEGRRPVIPVQADTLDHVLGRIPGHVTDDIALLWADVQGHEGHVFEGAGALLSRPLPAVIEVWPYGLRRAGMTQDDFSGIVARSWSNYWVLRNGRFIRYPIDVLYAYFDELGEHGSGNVILTR